MEQKWKDCTSYSRSDTEKKPSVWEIESGSIRIAVTKSHIRCPGIWVMNCHKLGLDCRELGVETKEEAQSESKLVVHEIVAKLLKDIDEII